MSSNWAICIGVNRYVNLQALDFAEEDAAALWHFFESEMGFQKVYYFAENAAPIMDDFGRPIVSQPTYGSLMRFLRVRFDQAFLKPSDNLWFFFAGHGTRESDQDFLLPCDADPGNVGRTAIPVSHVCERLKRSGADNVILLLDACRSEGARDGQGIGLEHQKGVVTVCSCSPTEKSYEIGELTHGVFTYGLLEALRLQGHNNCATVERLDTYLRHRVPEICTQYRKPKQTPYTFVEPISKRHLILLPKAALPEDLESLKLDALGSEAEGDFALAEQLWWRVIAVSPTDAQAHEAVRRIALKIAGKYDFRRTGDVVEKNSKPSANRFDRTLGRVASRRKVLLFAGGTAATAIAGALAPHWLRRTIPPLRTIEIKTKSVNQKGILTDWKYSVVSIFKEPLGEDVSLELAVLPSGQFTMGSSDESERRSNEGVPHLVSISTLAMARTTINQVQWRTVCRAAAAGNELQLNPSTFHGDDLPVENVSWEQATKFCALLSNITGRPYRLPSEAEWEYACRANTRTPFHFGPTITSELANYCGTGWAVSGLNRGKDISSNWYEGTYYDSGAYDAGPAGTFIGKTTPCASYLPNMFGLFDMHGNVWEHCLDTWRDAYPDADTDGQPYLKGEQNLRVIRGGSWSHNPAICRSAYREPMKAGFGGWDGRVGLRVVCEL